MTVSPVREVLALDEARELTDRIRATVHAAHDLIAVAYQGQVWLALGYENWEVYCSAEFGDTRTIRLGREQRREIVADLSDKGLSTRAIASGLGVSKNTVTGDLSQTGTPDTVTGRDGKTYPRERKPNRRALPDVFSSVSFDLTKVVEKLERLVNDDRFTQNKEQITGKHRGDLLRAAEALAGVLNQLSIPEGE